jgi:hypothetical protein
MMYVVVNLKIIECCCFLICFRIRYIIY